MIAVLAGRRPDSRDAQKIQFPVGNAVFVRERLRQTMLDRGVHMLVCSAACGADLLALDVAGDLGIEREVVLPFDSASFREVSVVDRPGHWEELYDRIIEEVSREEALVVLERDGDDGKAFAAASAEILRRAEHLAGAGGKEGGELSDADSGVLVVAVWEGEPREEGDMTLEMVQGAQARGFESVHVSTRYPDEKSAE